MGAIRVTQRMLVDRILSNLAYQSRRILSYQEQLATGNKVNRPSDNPLNVRSAISARVRIYQNEQYLSNITSARPYLNESESAVMTVMNVVQRAKELALQGANGSNSQLQRNQIATEVNQLLESALKEANHQTYGKYIFGGAVTMTKPFQETRGLSGEINSVSYVGDDNYIYVEISEGSQVNINLTGREVFLPTITGSTDIFQALADLRDNLRTGNVSALQQRIDELTRAINQLSLALAKIGAITNRMETTEQDLESANIELRRVISDNIEADMAEVIVNLNSQTNAYQSALNAASKVIQPSLLDYIR
ncbi:MAG: flagellar hook-associated protein FlgL [Candidatus Hydrogenedentes bacterium]|nr:flagellar hook-associated protein FlgL [Candidatus Hydrogenedentota bacterium]